MRKVVCIAALAAFVAYMYLFINTPTFVVTGTCHVGWNAESMKCPAEGLIVYAGLDKILTRPTEALKGGQTRQCSWRRQPVPLTPYSYRSGRVIWCPPQIRIVLVTSLGASPGRFFLDTQPSTCESAKVRYA